MNHFTIAALSLVSLALLAGCWIGLQLLRQNGRMLLRIEEIEKRLDDLEFGEPDNHQSEEARTPVQSPESGVQSEGSLGTNGDGRADRFRNRSLARSRIKRDGLKAGTSAPEFRLPRLDGRGELALEELRGRRVLLVFSDPHCGPCNALAPELEKFFRRHGINTRPPSPRPSPPGEGEQSPALEVVMISRGEPKENRAEVKAHRLTFPVVLQHQWEISRRYAMFATPVAYLIDEDGFITHDVAVGVEAIVALMQQTVEPRMLAAREAGDADQGGLLSARQEGLDDA